MNPDLPPPLPVQEPRAPAPAWPFFLGVLPLAAACFFIRLKRLQALHPAGLTPYAQGQLAGGFAVIPLVALGICACVPSLRNRRSVGVALLIAFGMNLMTLLRQGMRFP